jgi:hypothetical protein
MQTEPSPDDARSSWPGWAEFLQRYGLGHFAAWALEAAGPLSLVGAQLLYASSPFLQPAVSRQQINRLAGMLEDRRELQDFASFLREESR